MNIFDQILASGYYAFDGKLNSHIVRMGITFLRKSGRVFHRDELIMKEIKKYMYFENQQYLLKDEFTVSDLGEFIDTNLVAMFHNLKIARDKFYSNRLEIEDSKKMIKRI